MDLMWVMLGFFLFVTIVFVVFAVAFPEWVGITGKKAKEIQKDQHEAEISAEATSRPTDTPQ
ncbi:MAG: hypothetical protein H7328_02280 [Bdellovibrio sp.]|nr:hypothetical protein [Bdellovibrio sp.]